MLLSAWTWALVFQSLQAMQCVRSEACAGMLGNAALNVAS
jgi:hypothetical protein